MTTILETKRLLLRPLTLKDVDDLAAIYADAEVMRYFPSGIRSKAATQANIEWIQTLYKQYGFGLWATIYKPDGRFIGRCGLLPEETEAGMEYEVAYMIARSYWGLGLATEAAQVIRDYAFQTLSFSRLVSFIHPDNMASQKVAQKCGMEYKQDKIIKGHVCHVYSVQRGDNPCA